MSSTMKVTDNLRQLIDAKHAQALEAVKILQEYLDKVPVTGLAPLPSLLNGKPASVERGGFTEAVLAAIRHEWASASQIAAKTGLEVKRVRGVLNAPRMKGKLARKIVNDQTVYRLEDKAGQEGS
jgi:hypothetical protein